MSPDEAALRERIQKVEAIIARPGSEGERKAAQDALARLQARLAELEYERSLQEYRISIPDLYWRALFIGCVANMEQKRIATRGSEGAH